METPVSEKSSGGFWAVFGKISLVVTVVGGIIGIYLVVFPNGPNLVAKCDYNSYALPPDLIKTIRNVQQSESSFAIAKEMESIWNETNKPEESLKTDAVANHLEAFLEANWPEKFRFSANPYQSFWYITIQNSGNRIANDVVLDVPLTGVALVTGRDEAQKVQVITNTIPLGPIRPGDSISLAIWASDKSTWVESSDFRLTHASGIGSVSFPSSFYGFRAVVARNLGFICLIVTVAAWWAVIIICGAASVGRKAKEKVKQQTKKEEKSQ